MLDERFRRAVGDVAAVDEGGLDEAARERLIARVVADGPGLVRGARRARFFLTAAGPVLAAAAAAAVLLRHPVETPPRTTELVPAPARVAAGPACASRSVVESAKAGFVLGSSGTRLDLGAVAVAAATPGASVKLAEATPCRTAITLDSGTVAVHARDLGGGELVVHAPGGDVTVHGTIFAVTQRPDAFLVEVVEGRVGVTDRGGSHTVVGGGRLLVATTGILQGTLSTERSDAVRSAVGAPRIVGFDALQPVDETSATTARPGNAGAAPRATTATAGSTPSVAALAPAAVELSETAEKAEAPASRAPADPLALAEEARRAGDFQKARDLYRRAGDGVGVTAEAAWVALARMELSLGHSGAALEATKRRQARFGQGTLGPEALWIDVRAYRQTGDMTRARGLAADLVGRWPSSPQAHAAEQWLSAK